MTKFPAYRARQRRGGVVELDLKTGGAFVRATEAFRQTAAPNSGGGFADWATSGTRRIVNFGDGLGDGLLLEGARTNILTRSRDITNATGWNQPSFGGAVLTADHSSGPDGATLADRVECTGAQFSRGHGLSGLMTSPHTISIWARATSGTSKFYSNYAASARHSLGSIGTTWARYAFTTASTGAAYYPVDSSLAGASPQDVLIDLHQAENGQWASTPIRTSGSTGTRNADELSYASFPASLLTDGFQIEVALQPSTADILTSGDAHPLLSTNGGDDCAVVYVDGGAVKLGLFRNSTLVVDRAFTASAEQALTFTVRPAAGQIEIAGATTGNGTASGSGGAWTSDGTLVVGYADLFGDRFYGRILNNAVIVGAP